MVNLAIWRKKKGLSQTEFGSRVGLQKGFVSEIERGRKRPSPESAKRIEGATNGEVTAAELLGLTVEKVVREDSPRFMPELSLNDEARKLGLDPDVIAARAIEAAVKCKRMEAWIDDNKEAFSAHRRDVEENGLWSDGLRQF